MLGKLPGGEVRLMTKFAAEALTAQRDQAIKSALKAKVPLYDIMEDFGLTEVEITKILMDQNQAAPTKDGLLDAREEVISGRGRR